MTFPVSTATDFDDEVTAWRRDIHKHPELGFNEVRTAEDVKLGFSVAGVCRRYFGIEAEYLGYVNYDDEARQSVSARRPIVVRWGRGIARRRSVRAGTAPANGSSAKSASCPTTWQAPACRCRNRRHRPERLRNRDTARYPLPAASGLCA